MTRYAAFLRGVNVGGVTLKMAALTQALEAAGFTGVRTILASGNVLLDSEADAGAVRDLAERTLRDEFGYEAWVLVYGLDTVAQISSAYPFPREVEGHHSYVTFVSDDDVLRELSELARQPGPGEHRGDRGLHGGERDRRLADDRGCVDPARRRRPASR